ncbi:hypothetical protein [Saccharolobus islandicus]|uniref:Uncharacterized protein n=6 Tax=Saccharolobus islandicus TaxID=43080 RepID=M9U9M7_SACIS|nr:hypothetical protein [Sulfolobus islandicus]ACP38218.1 conserved hypothetical protein [Sulfolobus islandicus M.14.25]ACP55464.1 conserved hypothetical protein [Sulfolobus islandicus M.16.27]ACR42066.1 conserved hypothetical protein [Sulfolobus islandicus M.16.4]ADX82759.1 conserved hypothetical protein [Sulfolobus islandicus HVE10/4]ADX85410.1 conserved hypothetical protein [Sulfolobus islandicus REY15A]
MYKVIFRIKGGYGTSFRELRQANFTPIYFRKDKGEEYYITLFRGKDLSEVKEAILDLSYYLSKYGKYGDHNFATIYEVKNQNFGKVAGGALGALAGYYLGGLAGLFVGALGGIFLGELLDIEMGEKLVGVLGWPMSISR